MKHLKRTDIEAIGKDIYTQYRKLPEIRSARIICNIQPDLLIEKLLGFKIEYHHLSLSGEVLGITCTDEIGIENTVAIYRLFHGTQVSFPGRLFSKEYIHKAIIEEYNGSNVPQLAQKYNYSERSVWRILKINKEK